MARIKRSNTLTSYNLPIPGARSTTAQICTKYQFSRTTLWRWSQMPGFPKPIRFGRSVRWDDSAIEAFLTQPEA